MNQKGLTLVELLVSLAVSGMVIAAVVSGIFQIIQGGGQITGKTVALADIESAAHWLTRDVVMGQLTSLIEGAPPTTQMTMTWNDLTVWAEQEGSVSHSVTYTYNAGTSELQRDYDGTVTTVGRNLAGVGFSLNGKLVTVTLTADRDGDPRSTVTKSYVIQMRAGP